MGKRHAVVLVFCLLLACSGCSRASRYTISAPLFAWSSQAMLKPADGQSHTQKMQVHGNLRAAVDSLFGDTISVDADQSRNRPEASAQPEVTLAVLGTAQMRSSHLKDRAMHAVIQPLLVMLDKASSSLTAPYVLHEGAGRVEQSSQLEALADELQMHTTVVGCRPDSMVDLDAALQQQQVGRRIIVMCTQQPSHAAGLLEAVSADLQQLQDAHDKVAALGKSHLTIYAPVPDEADSRSIQRQLLGVGADVGSCGQLCQTQVKWLEGILAALLLATAAFSGMCCLYMLDTPTRFEKPKEGGRNE